MLILGLDSSSAACSVAISRDGEVIGGTTTEMTRGHAAALPPMIAETLKETGHGARDMDAFAVSIGPGSFTGLRVAMAVAKGLAVARDRPLLGISCFDAVARKADATRGPARMDMLLLTLASKREEVFVHALDGNGRAVISNEVLTPYEIDRRLGAVLDANSVLHIAGEAMDSVVNTLRGPNAACRARLILGPALPPGAREIALLAHERMTGNEPSLQGYESGLAPLYLRPPATTTKKS